MCFRHSERLFLAVTKPKDRFDITDPIYHDTEEHLGNVPYELTPKESLFLSYYLQSFNGTKAAQLAYPNVNKLRASREASAMLKKLHIRQVIDDYLEAAQVDARQVIARLGYFANESNVSHFVTYDENGKPEINLSTQAARDNMRLVKKLTHTTTTRTDKEGNTTVTDKIGIEVYSALEAMNILTRHFDSIPQPKADDPALEVKPMYIVVNPVQALPSEDTQDGQDGAQD